MYVERETIASFLWILYQDLSGELNVCRQDTLRKNGKYIFNKVVAVGSSYRIIKERHPVVRPAIHPGEILADELKELGMSAAELARTLHVPTNRITQIINGQRGIPADTVLRLG